MDIIAQAEGWLFQVAAKKVIAAAVKLVVSLVLAVKVQPFLSQAGVTVDPAKMQEGLTVLAYGALEALHDYLKLKYPNVVKF